MRRTWALLSAILIGCFSGSAPSADTGSRQEEQEIFRLKAAGDVKPAPFDGKRALKYLTAICDIGPRQSGTPGMNEQIKVITKHFEDLGFKVEVQTFSGKQVSRP